MFFAENFPPFHYQLIKMFPVSYSGSLFTNSNWFAFENDLIANDRTTGLLASPSPDIKESGIVKDGADDEVIVGDDDDLDDTATSSPESQGTSDRSHNVTNSSKEMVADETDKPPEWVEWRETSNHEDSSLTLPNGELAVVSEVTEPDAIVPSPSTDALIGKEAAVGQVPAPTHDDGSFDSSDVSISGGNVNVKSKSTTSEETVDTGAEAGAGAIDVTMGDKNTEEAGN